MKKIPLGKSGKFALVDDEDFENVSRFKWQLALRNNRTYARCQLHMGNICGSDKRCTVYLHQLIMRPPKNMDVDHKDHNGINCLRGNMRICTRSQNLQNKRDNRGASRFKGVIWDTRSGRWRVKLSYNKKENHIGFFEDENKAACAYDRAAIKYFGEYAYTNFPRKDYKNELESNLQVIF